MSFKAFRKYQRVSLWILVVFTVITFSLFSVSSALKTCFSEPGESVDDYGHFTLQDGTKVVITVERYFEAKNALRVIRQGGEDAILRHIVLHEEATRAGVMVSDRELQDWIIARLPEDATAEVYRSQYRYNGFVTPQAYEDAVREVLTVFKLQGFYMSHDDCYLTAEAYEQWAEANEEFKLDYITFNVADYEEAYPEADVKEEDLTKFYDTVRPGPGRPDYTENERFTLDFASVDLDAVDFEAYAELTADIEIAEDRIESYYSRTKDRFLIEEVEEEEPAPEAGKSEETGTEPEGETETEPEGETGEETPEDGEEEKEPSYQPIEEVRDLLLKEMKVLDLVDKAHTEFVDFITENDLLEKPEQPEPPVKEEEEETEGEGEPAEEEPAEEETPDADAFFKELCAKYKLTHTRTEGAVSWDDLAEYEGFGSDTFKARIRSQVGNGSIVIMPGAVGGRIGFLARVVEKVPLKKKELADVRETAMAEFLKIKRMELCYDAARDFRDSLETRVSEFEDLKPEVEKIEAEEKAAAEERIAQRNKAAEENPDEEFTEEAAEDLRAEGGRRADGRVTRYLEKHLHRAFSDVCAEKGFEPVLIDTFSKAVARDPEALEGCSPAEKFLKKHPYITRSYKNQVLTPLRATEEDACYLVRIIDRGLPAPEKMTKEDVTEELGTIRMNKWRERYMARSRGEAIEDDRFTIKTIRADYAVTVNRPERTEEEAPEEGTSEE